MASLLIWHGVKLQLLHELPQGLHAQHELKADEAPEHPVVQLSDAPTDPKTVVIVFGDALVALRAVLRAVRLEVLADVAVVALGHLGDHLRLDVLIFLLRLPMDARHRHPVQLDVVHGQNGP